MNAKAAINLNQFQTLGRNEFDLPDLMIVSRQHVEIKVLEDGDGLCCTIRALHTNAIKVTSLF